MKKRFIVFVSILFIVFLTCLFIGYKRDSKIIVGKDTVAIFCDGLFQIGKYSREKHLVCCLDNGTNSAILRHVKKYKEEIKKIYVYSDEGFAVIYKDNSTCKVYLNYTDEEFQQEYIIEDGHKIWFMHDLNIASKNVLLVRDFDDFSDKEKCVLSKLKVSAAKS